MLRPSITDYIATLENPTGVFRTLAGVEVERDIYGEPALLAGNSAAIFTYTNSDPALKANDRPRRFLKCYIRPNPHLCTIYEYVERVASPLLPAVRLLPGEMYVHSLSGKADWVDVVEGEWIPGRTLDAEVAQAAHEGNAVRLGGLADAFDRLCCALLAAEWAHGDLKPENIIVQADGALTLIDCDAMWIPALEGAGAAEFGTLAYRHPARTAADFDKRMDDYPAMLISVSLHALAVSPELYPRYNTPDILLLSPGEVVDESSAAHAEMLALFMREGMGRQYRMTEALAVSRPENLFAEMFFPPPSDPLRHDMRQTKNT
jgi:serine/threonine protein kinase